MDPPHSWSKVKPCSRGFKKPPSLVYCGNSKVSGGFSTSRSSSSRPSFHCAVVFFKCVGHESMTPTLTFGLKSRFLAQILTPTCFQDWYWPIAKVKQPKSLPQTHWTLNPRVQIVWFCLFVLAIRRPCGQDADGAVFDFRSLQLKLRRKLRSAEGFGRFGPLGRQQ